MDHEGRVFGGRVEFVHGEIIGFLVALERAIEDTLVCVTATSFMPVGRRPDRLFKAASSAHQSSSSFSSEQPFSSPPKRFFCSSKQLI